MTAKPRNPGNPCGSIVPIHDGAMPAHQTGELAGSRARTSTLLDTFATKSHGVSRPMLLSARARRDGESVLELPASRSLLIGGCVSNAALMASSAGTGAQGLRLRQAGAGGLPWGLVMTVTDPFSNRIRFCEEPAP